MLVELDTSLDTKLTQPVPNDWAYWEKRAGRLISTLESQLGYKRGMSREDRASANLFAYRAAAAGLADAKGLKPLVDELNGLCVTTGRPSLLIIWMPKEGRVYVAVHDQNELDAGAAFVMLQAVDTGPGDVWLGGALTYPYIAPPCVVRTPALSAPLRHAEYATPFEERTLIVQELLHCVVGATVNVIVDSALVKLAEANPAGAAFKLMTPTMPRIMDTFTDLAIEPLTLNMSLIAAPGGVGGSLGLSYDMGTFKQHFVDEFCGKTLTDTYNAVQRGDWGGVLLAPKLTVVLDESGLTSALAGKAVEAVQAGESGEFEHEGETYIAVKAPGTAGLSRVPVGAFQLYHVDLAVEGEGRTLVRLERFYDSRTTDDSPLGQGWSLAPFALEVGQRVMAPDEMTEVALRPVLLDRRAGARLAYRLEEDTGPVAPSRDSQVVAGYDKLTSSLQPNLTARSDGGYLASFAHGFQIAFNKQGRLEWLGWDESDRVTYAHDQEGLTGIHGAGARVTLGYDQQGRLTKARSSDGRAVTYGIDEAGRLRSVAGAESGHLSCTYGADRRLATVRVNDETLAANTYDDGGRMLTHRTPHGESRFAYDDRVRCLTVTGPDGEDTQYFYDDERRLGSYGASKKNMTLLNYDVTGRVLQVCVAELVNDPSTGAKPKFTCSETVAPMPKTPEQEETE
ncbi:MAG: hypothetical protein KKI02_02095 [Planctomycetes bacterium]|nr:hypothetical protein [Planctomycetota bacterium]